MSAAGLGLGGCAWRRCSHQAVVVAFALPHRLAGTSRGYCGFHARQVAGQPGVTLAVAAGGVAVQPALPGLDPTSAPGWPPHRVGGR